MGDGHTKRTYINTYIHTYIHRCAHRWYDYEGLGPKINRLLETARITIKIYLQVDADLLSCLEAVVLM